MVGDGEGDGKAGRPYGRGVGRVGPGYGMFWRTGPYQRLCMARLTLWPIFLNRGS